MFQISENPTNTSNKKSQDSPWKQFLNIHAQVETIIQDIL